MNKQELLTTLKEKNFSDQIIAAFSEVKREDFVPEHMREYAYENIALPIQEGHSLSQPSTVAFILDLLELKENQNQKILEIGAGTGYALALIAAITRQGELYGLEIQQDIAIKAKQRLEYIPRIHILASSGTNGLPEHAPFDRILVSAASESLDQLTPLIAQLTPDGILVAPINQKLIQIKKHDGKVTTKQFEGFAFVPLRNENSQVAK